MKIELGSYVQVFENHNVTNTIKTRTLGVIVISTKADETDKYSFMSLQTGKILRRRKFTVLPITDYIIDRVDEFGSKDKQSKISDKCSLFEWRPGYPIAIITETLSQANEEKTTDKDQVENITIDIGEEENDRSVTTEDELSLSSDENSFGPRILDDSTSLSENKPIEEIETN